MHSPSLLGGRALHWIWWQQWLWACWDERPENHAPRADRQHDQLHGNIATGRLRFPFQYRQGSHAPSSWRDWIWLEPLQLTAVSSIYCLPSMHACFTSIHFLIMLLCYQYILAFKLVAWIQLLRVLGLRHFELATEVQTWLSLSAREMIIILQDRNTPFP